MRPRPQRRLPAEWEPQQLIQFTFPHPDSDWDTHWPAIVDVFVELVKIVTQFQVALVVTHNRSFAQQALEGIPKDRLQIVACPSNDTWVRDHGPISVIQDGQLRLQDFGFNGWGLKFPANYDNLITKTLHTWGLYGDLPLDQPGLILEGGAIETDGQGTLLTTRACLLSPNRNPQFDQQTLEEQLFHHLGVDHFLWLEDGYLAGDDTDSHIDTLARFCNPNTIAYVRCDDENDEHYAELLLMEQALQAFRNKRGEPYQLVSLPWPTACYAADGHRLPATYANFLIINGAVLVPTYGIPEDDLALRVLTDCFPDRKVIGVDCRLLIEQHGSLHCVTIQIPVGAQ